MSSDMSFDPSIPLEMVDTELDDIIYRISHDLRASVRALQELPIWIIEDLDKAAVNLPAESSRHLELIGSHACRLDLMLTGLLEYSRVGRLQAIAPIKPKDVLDDVADDLAAAGDIKIVNKLDRGMVQMGEADLQRVFSILMTNAIRFHPDKKPRIEVTGGPKSEKTWEICVSDNGTGIPEAKRDFVQRPMTKLVSRDVDPGAGMGLAILRKIAEAYGGGLDIFEPKSGQGTTVRVSLAVN